MMRFRGLNVRMCSGCLEKMREIDRLKHKLDRKSRRIASLEKKLGERRRSPDELPFGASTPSSKLPFKDNSPDEKRRLKGGAKPGHVGHGRKVPEAFEPPERIGAGCFCPGCGGNAKVRKTERRHVRDYIPERVVDRYRAYNRLPFELQYCYAHLKRDVEKLEKEFPKSVEVRKFCRALGRQLAAAMGLRKKKTVRSQILCESSKDRIENRRHMRQPGQAPGYSRHTEYFPPKSASSLPLGPRPSRAGRQQLLRARTAPPGHFAQAQFRHTVGRGVTNKNRSDECAAFAGKAGVRSCLQAPGGH